MTRTLGSNLAFNVSPRAYIELVKPRIVILLVFTCVTSMIVAVDSIPPVDLLALTALGGMLSAGGASAINQYLDRGLDVKMARTSRRPIPSGRVPAGHALAFGVALVISSVLVLGLFVNWLAAVLALAGAIYYVVIYTLILKRNTVVNILIGGGAGAMPVLGGLGGGKWLDRASGFHLVRHRLLLDATALLGAGYPGQQRLCRSGYTHDAGGAW